MKTDYPKFNSPRIFLIADMGTSPAVLTEKLGGLRANVMYFAVETKP